MDEKVVSSARFLDRVDFFTIWLFYRHKSGKITFLAIANIV